MMAIKFKKTKCGSKKKFGSRSSPVNNTRQSLHWQGLSKVPLPTIPLCKTFVRSLEHGTGSYRLQNSTIDRKGIQD